MKVSNSQASQHYEKNNISLILAIFADLVSEFFVSVLLVIRLHTIVTLDILSVLELLIMSGIS